MLEKCFERLLPRGSFFAKTGKRINALMSAICWQFRLLKNFYIKASKEANVDEAESLDALEAEYGLETKNMHKKDIKILLEFLKKIPSDPSRKAFFNSLFKFFPQMRFYSNPKSHIMYSENQANVFICGATELVGDTEDFLPRKDGVFLAGTVRTLFEKRKLKWFLERYDRAHHKYTVSVTVAEAHASAMSNSNQVGVLVLGSYHNGPI